MKGRKCRVAMYSPGMVGLGHIRRHASIAHALSRSSLQPIIVMIAEARGWTLTESKSALDWTRK